MPERSSLFQASPPAKPPRTLEYIELASPLASFEERVIEGHEYSEPQVPAEMLRPSTSSALTPAGESQSIPLFDDNTEMEIPPLPARNGTPMGADRESLADQGDGRSAESTPSRRDSRSGSFASANHYTPIDDRPAELTSARRDNAAESNVSVTPTVNRQRDDAVELEAAAAITAVPPEVIAKPVATPYPDYKTEAVVTGKDNGDTPSHSGDTNDSGDLSPAGNGNNHLPLTHDNGGNDNGHSSQADNESDNVSQAEDGNESGNVSQVEDGNESGHIYQASGEDDNGSLPPADGENESVTVHAGGHVMGDELDEEDGREDGSPTGTPPFAPPTISSLRLGFMPLTMPWPTPYLSAAVQSATRQQV